MPTIEEIQEQIKRLDGTSKLLGFKEIGELPNILWEDEKVEAIIQGRYADRNGILVATNKRLIFVEKGLLWGLRVEDFEYSKVSSIQYNAGLILGKITVFAAGNKAEIDQVPKQQGKTFTDYVRARMTGATPHASYKELAATSEKPTGTKICPECGKPIADEANFCAGCGKQIPQTLIAQEISSSKPEPPATGKREGETGVAKKGCLGCLGLIIVLVVVVAIFGGSSDKTKPSTVPATTQQQGQAKQTAEAPKKSAREANIISNNFLSFDKAYDEKTDIQRTEYWKQVRGKYVKWTGTVADVRDGGNIYFIVRPDTLVADFVADFGSSPEAKKTLVNIKKGTRLTIIGKLLGDKGAVMPWLLEDIEIVQ